MFRQCELRRNNTFQIVWLPEQFACRGAWLKLSDEDGWKVEKVYARSDGHGLNADGRDQRRLFGSLN
jgi:hypothetical protein